MAGRVTLTKAVLTLISVHSMSTIALPQSTIEKLDKISRNFIWGSTMEQRRQHLVAWDQVCLPKTKGGLGIRSTREMNIALLAKMGWCLLQDKDSLWARVLRKKYRVADPHDTSWTIAKGHWSSTWRSVCAGLRESVIPGITWVLGDGRDIHFWTDKWLTDKWLTDKSLEAVVTTDLPLELRNVRARDLWENGIGWDFSRIMEYVPPHIRLCLLSVVLDTVIGAKDRMSWGHNPDGRFTVKSAYSLLTETERPSLQVSALFERVWRVVASERTRLFLWLGMKQVLMTNVERNRRHISNSSICEVCNGGEETIIHILRDCPTMSGIWTRIVPRMKQNSFFHQTLIEWLYENLEESTVTRGSRWSTTFALGVWWGWKWRCGNVFGETKKCRDRVKFIFDLSKEVTEAHANNRESHKVVERVERLIGWCPPSEGWMKLNTDGASRGNPGIATAGRVLRDCQGQWCGGFAVNIGVCSAPLAELWGVYYGLFLAWESGARRVELEVDSEVVAGFLTTGIRDTHPLSFLARLCYGFLSKDWIVRTRHVYREANRLADGLANYAFTLSLGYHALPTRPMFVDSIVMDDVNGAQSLRHVRL